MQNLKLFFKILSSKLSSTVPFVAAFICIAIAMASMGGADEAFTDTKVKFAVIDNDGTPSSRSLAEYLSKNNTLCELPDGGDGITDIIANGIADYVLVIKDGYEEKLAAGETDGILENYQRADSARCVFLENETDMYLKTVSGYILMGSDISEAVEKGERLVSEEIEVEMNDFSIKNETEFEPKFVNYYIYLAYGLLSVLIMALSPTLLALNQKEIKDRTACSSEKYSKRMIYTVMGCGIFSVGLWLIFCVVGIIMNGSALGFRHMLVIANSFLLLLVCTGLAIIVSCLAKTQESVGMISNIIGLGMCFLCGVFVPQSMLGDGVNSFARLLPVHWYVKSNDMIFQRNGAVYDFDKFVEYFIIQAAFAAIIFAVAFITPKLKKNK